MDSACSGAIPASPNREPAVEPRSLNEVCSADAKALPCRPPPSRSSISAGVRVAGEQLFELFDRQCGILKERAGRAIHPALSVIQHRTFSGTDAEYGSSHLHQRTTERQVDEVAMLKLGRASTMELKSDINDCDISHRLKRTGAIAVSRIAVTRSLTRSKVHRLDPRDNIGDLLAVRTNGTENRTSDRAGYAGHALDALVLVAATHSNKIIPAMSGGNRKTRCAIVVFFDSGYRIAGKPDDETIEALVADEAVTAVAQDEHGNSGPLRKLKQRGKLSRSRFAPERGGKLPIPNVV